MTYSVYSLFSLISRYDYKADRVATCFQEHSKAYGIVFKVGKASLSPAPKFGGTHFLVMHAESLDSPR